MAWLVTGGAGYIGAHLVRRLRAAGRDVVVVDDLSSGVSARLPRDVPLIVASVGDRDVLARVIEDHRVSGVVHLAALKNAAESVSIPLRYSAANVGGMQALLEVMAAQGIRRCVLASSAAVYGPDRALLDEGAALDPSTPYGRSKLVCEWMLRDTAATGRWSVAVLRYFNPVGTDGPEVLADRGPGLVPSLLRAARSGEPVQLFGHDYETVDGTGTRDYVHVADLVDAHLAAMNRVEREDVVLTCNVGSGVGRSVLQMLDAVEARTGLVVPYERRPRRAGDLPSVVGGIGRAGRELGWRPRRGINSMIDSAWAVGSDETGRTGTRFARLGAR